MKQVTRDLEGLCGIYKIVNLINGKSYIGSSKNIRMRLWEHRAKLRHNNHHNQHLQNSWNKYGEDNFDYCILELCSCEQQYAREQFYINSCHPEYNIAEEVILPSYSEESRRKHSETKKRMYAEGLLVPTRTTKIYMYNLNGEFIKEFSSEAEACRELNIYRTQIEKNLSGKYKRCHEFIFKYEYSPSIPPYDGKKGPKDLSKRWKPIRVYNDTEEYFFRNAQECANHFKVHVTYVRNAIRNQRKFKRMYMVEYTSARLQSNLFQK